MQGKAVHSDVRSLSQVFKSVPFVAWAVLLLGGVCLFVWGLVVGIVVARLVGSPAPLSSSSEDARSFALATFTPIVLPAVEAATAIPPSPLPTATGTPPPTATTKHPLVVLSSPTALEPTPTQLSPTPEPASAGSEALAPGGGCIPNNPAEPADLVRVIDGDTIDVFLNGETQRVRYIGMNTPEDTSIVEYFGPEATRKNGEILASGPLLLVKDVSETDRYGRLLRYVIAGGVFVNYELVAAGFASVTTYPPDVACVSTYLAAQQAAKENGFGFWAALTTERTYVIPTATRAYQSPAATQERPASCSASYPTVCIPDPDPDLDCKDIPYRRFKVLAPDPHNFDGDHDGIGCESD